VSLRVVRQFRRDRRSLAMVLVVPVVLMALVGYLVRNQGSNYTIAVVDQTGQGVAAALAREIEAAGQARTVVKDEAAAREAIKDGSVQGAVIASGSPAAPQLLLVLEGTQPSSARAIRQLVTRAVLGLQVAGAAVRPANAPEVIPAEYVYGGPEYDTLDFFAPALMGFFAFFLVFLLTAVSFQRERSAGTLERLMASPIRRSELIVGYAAGFGFFALLQAVLVVGASVLIFRIHHAGALGWVLVLVMILSLAAVNLGIFVSAFARTELQAMQFIPLVIVPQGLLCGVIWPVSSLPGWLGPVTKALPMTYAINALRGVMLKGEGLGDAHLLVNGGMVAGFAVLFAALAVATLRREVA